MNNKKTSITLHSTRLTMCIMVLLAIFTLSFKPDVPTIYIIGAVLVKQSHTLAELRGVEPVQIYGISQMPGGKLVRLPHVENHSSRVSLGSSDKVARTEHLHAVLRRAARAKPECRQDRKEKIFHVENFSC